MTDLKNPTVIWMKGWLFLVMGILSAGLLLANAPSLRNTALLAISVWAFCRFYYFAFYVIDSVNFDYARSQLMGVSQFAAIRSDVISC